MNDMDLSSEKNVPVALVTGGGSGIGAAIAGVLVKQGWLVVICGRRADTLERVATETGAEAVVADITDSEAISRLQKHIVHRYGKLNGMVLNAGVVRPGLVGELSGEDWAAMVETNLTAPYRLLQAFLPYLIDAKGSVVGVASVSALRASAGIAGYNTTKAGLSMLLRSVAVDYGPMGVRANVVCPGWTRSEMADAEMEQLGSERGLDMEGAYELASALVPLHRPAKAEETAAAVAWLLSPSASYLNAAVVPVDGGLSAVDPGTVAFDTRLSVAIK